MTTTTKTIFEKTYMVASQAEKAAAKEFGEGWAAQYVVVPAGKRFAVEAKPLEVPAAVLAGAPKAGAKALVERAVAALASIEQVAHDVVQNLSLAQALAESGETMEELKDEQPTKVGGKGTGIKIQKDRAEQNGVVRPSEGGVCAAIWAECDARSADGSVPAIKAMKEWATAKAIDLTTCTIQYYQWRKFMGVVGRAKEMPAK